MSCIFHPFITSVDVALGCEANVILKRIGKRLSFKWNYLFIVYLFIIILFVHLLLKIKINIVLVCLNRTSFILGP